MSTGFQSKELATSLAPYYIVPCGRGIVNKKFYLFTVCSNTATAETAASTVVFQLINLDEVRG